MVSYCSGHVNQHNHCKKNPCVVVIHSEQEGLDCGQVKLAVAGARWLWALLAVHESKVQTFYQRIQPLCPSAQCLNGATILESLHTAWSTLFVEHDPMLLDYQYPNEVNAQDLVQAGWGCDVLTESYGGESTFSCPWI